MSSNLFPVFCAKLVNELGKLLIFLGIPVSFGVVRVREVVGPLDEVWLTNATVVINSSLAQTSCLICQTQASPVLASLLHEMLEGGSLVISLLLGLLGLRVKFDEALGVLNYFPAGQSEICFLG